MLKKKLVLNVILNANFEISNQKFITNTRKTKYDFKENSIMFPIEADSIMYIPFVLLNAFLCKKKKKYIVCKPSCN